MNLGDLRALVAIGAVLVGVSSYGFTMDQRSRSNKEILDSLEKRQAQIADWMDQQIQRERAIAVQKDLLRQLCRTGQVTDEALCRQVEPPTEEAE